MSFCSYLPQQKKIKKKARAKTDTQQNFVVNTDFTLKPTTRVETKKITTKISQNSSDDILHVDEEIRKSLHGRISTLPELQKDLDTLLWISRSSDNPLDKLKAKKEVEILRRRMTDIEGGFELMLYLLQTSSLLDKYRRLKAETQQRTFVVETKADESKLDDINTITFEYLRVARNYINLDKKFASSIRKATCPSCKNVLYRQDTKTAALICKCGVQVDQLDDKPSFKDTDRVNMASRYVYTTRGHFIDAMNRFEGKQNTEIPDSVIQILKCEIKKHGLSIKRQTVTKDHVYMFMSEQQLGDYYGDFNLIYFLVTGISPPNITELRTELLEINEFIDEAYVEIRGPERSNSLNVDFKLYKGLQLICFKCSKADFYCLKTPTKQSEHEEKWAEMIDLLKARYPDALTSQGHKRWRYLKTT